MRLRLRFGTFARIRAAFRIVWQRRAQWFMKLQPAGRLVRSALSALSGLLLIYIIPALATGLVFAAALGRYTTETQFAQNAFQNYLRPYQVQYRSCLSQMDMLRERWENLGALIDFAANNADPSATAPIVIFTSEGSISIDKDDDAEKVLGKIVVASRRVNLH